METTNHHGSPDREERLNEVMAAYLETMDAGENPRRETWLDRYPEFADDLRNLFAAQDQFAPLRPQRDPSGTRILYVGDYELLEELGRGGMGVVHKARQVSLNRTVAVKLILDSNLVSEADIRRFHIEAESAANLQHPGIVAVYEVGVHQGQHYFSMAYVEGTTLAGLIREGPLPASQAARYIRQIAAAVHYAHQQGTLHRDLKPSNILIDLEDQPHITDFGLAKRVGAPGTPGRDSNLTTSGAVLGTPSYISPEQAQSKQEDLGPSTDVYSLGATLYAALTGRPPFQSASVMETLQQVIHNPPVSPRTLNPTVPRDLETMCLKCLEKEPRRRYGSAQEVADELQRYLDGKPVLARPVGAAGRLWRWCKRQPVVAGLTAAVALTLVAGALISSVLAINFYTERNRANQNADRAEGKTNEVLEERKKAQRQLALSYIERGVNELEHGEPLRGFNELEHREPARGFAMLGQAYRAAVSANDSELRRSVCALLGAWQFSFELRLPPTDENYAHSEMAFSPDGTKVATQCDDNIVRLWDASTGKPLGLPMKHNGGVQVVAFSPDGTKLATASGYTAGHSDGAKFTNDSVYAARLWDAATGRPLGPPMKHESEVSSLIFSPDGRKLATISGFESHVWNTETGQPLRPPMKHGRVNAASFSADGAKIATASMDDNSARLWDVATGRPLGPPMKHDHRVEAVAFSPDGTKVATASWMTARLWDVATCQPIGLPMKHDSKVLNVAFSPDGTNIAAADQDYNVWLWDVSTCQAVGLPIKSDYHESYWGMKHQLVFSPDGTIVANAGDYFTPRLLVVALRRPLGGLNNSRHFAAFSSDGSMIATSGGANTLLFEAPTLLPPRLSINNNLVSARNVVLSADGTKFVTTSHSAAQVRKVAIRKPIGPPIKNPDPFFGDLALNADGTKVAVRNGVTVQVCDAVTGQPLGKTIKQPDLVGTGFSNADGTTNANLMSNWMLHSDPPYTPDRRELALSADGTKIATAFGTAARLWDVESGRLLGTLLNENENPYCLAFSPDGTKVATTSKTVARLWDVATCKPVGRPMTHDRTVDVVDFSRDGTKIVTTSDDYTVRLWDTATCQPLGLPMRHDDLVLAVAFSPDGTKLASASDDGAVRLWDVATGRGLGPPMKYSKRMVAVAFSPDGSKITTVCEDNSVKYWPVPRRLPDDPRWVTAYVDVRSAWKEDADAMIHRITAAEAKEAWRDVLMLPDLLDRCRQDAAQRACAWHEIEAQTCEAAKNWFAAAFHLRWLCKLEPNNPEWQKRFVEAKKQLDLKLDAAAADGKIAAGRTREAVADLVTASVADPADTLLSLKVATLQAWFGLDKELSETCRRGLEFAAGAADASTASRMAKICCLLPTTDKTRLDAALAFARKALELGKGDPLYPWFLLTLGMAEYRNGHFAAADAALLDAKGNPVISQTAAFYRAMTLFRQGKPDEARKLALDAASKMKSLPADEKNPLAAGSSHDDLILWLAYKEATKLIQIDATPTTPARQTESRARP